MRNKNTKKYLIEYVLAGLLAVCLILGLESAFGQSVRVERADQIVPNDPTNTAVDVSPALSIDGGIEVDAVLDEDDMTSDSATAVPTQQSTKAYVDTGLSTKVTGQAGLVPDCRVAVFDGGGGYSIKGTPVCIDASGNVTGVADLTATGAIGGATVEGTTSVTGGNITLAGDVISSTNDMELSSATGQYIKIDASGNAATVGSNNPELLNRLSYPSFEEAITSVTISGGTGSSETTETFDGSRSLGWALSAETGTATATVSDTRLSGVQIEASCYVKTSASGVVFKAQRNGSDIAGLSINVPNDDTWRLIGIPFVGGSTSSGFQIEATGSITDSIFIDQCSVGTDFRVNDFSQVTGSQEIVFAKNNGGTTITSDTTPLDWTEIRDPFGMWDGSTFTPSETAIYSITFGVSFSSASARTLDLWANSGSGYAQYIVLGTNYSNADGNGAFVGKLDAGTTYQIRSRTGGTLAISTVTHYLSISRVKSANTITLGPDNFTGLTATKDMSVTCSWTNTTCEGEYWRVGNRAHMRVRATLTGTPSGAGFIVTLPFNLDTSSITYDTEDNTNTASIYDNGASILTARVQPASSNSVVVKYEAVSGSLVGPTTVSTSAPITFTTGDEIHLNFSFPIEGWDQGAAVVEVDPCQTRSTSETACAQWWVDGSRIYQRCAVLDSDVVGTATATIATWVSGLSPINAFQRNDGGVYIVKQIINDSTGSSIAFEYVPSTGVLRVSVVGAENEAQAGNRICMEYTK